MKKVLVGSLALATLMAAASVSAHEHHRWTGAYVGVNAGGAWNDSKYTLSPDSCFLSGTCTNNVGGGATTTTLNLITFAKDLDKGGFIGGVDVGYNWEHRNFIYGVEADFDYYSLNDTKSVSGAALVSPITGNVTYKVEEKMSWLSTVRGRVGRLVTPCTLLYVTGGLAVADVKSHTDAYFSTAGDSYQGKTNSKTTLGWTAGLGGQYSFTHNVLGKIEYLYADFNHLGYNDPSVNTVSGTTASFQTHLKDAQNIVRVGVDYRF